MCPFDRSVPQYHVVSRALADAARRSWPQFYGRVRARWPGHRKQAGELRGKLIAVKPRTKTVKGVGFLHSPGL